MTYRDSDAQTAKRITTLSMLVAMGSVMYLLESLIPFPLPVPGGRWGFSNLVLLLAVNGLSLRDTLYLAIGKTLVGGLLTGRLGTPGFIMGISGIVASALLMWLLSRSRLFGMAGISLAGAAVSNLVQLFVAAWLIVRSGEILFLYPYMLLLGSISALINAYIAHEVIRRIGNTIWFD